MTVAGPGELLAAIKSAKAGDTIEVHGLQDLGGRFTNSKRLTLTNGAGQRATLLGALIDAGGLNLDGGEDPFNGFILDDPTPVDSVGRPSWIINAPNVTWSGFEATNRHTKIGLQPNDYGAGGANFHARNGWIHNVGPLYTSQAAAGSQAVKRLDGTWVDNHAHGAYQSGLTGCIFEDMLFEDCSDRGFQARSGARGTVVRRILIRACGMGFMFGDPCYDISLSDSILLDNLCASRALLEQYNPGTGNTATNVVGFNKDGRKAVATSSVKLTNVRSVDPLYDPAARKLKPGSPALGLGPTWIQPGAAPAPDPTPDPVPDPTPARDLTTVSITVKDGVYYLTGTKGPGIPSANWNGGNRNNALAMLDKFGQRLK